MREPVDADLWRSVEVTVRDVLLPSLTDDWARVVAIQLVGLAEFARTRPDDPLPGRVTELVEVLDGLAANPIVAAHRPASDDAAAVLGAVSAILADAVAHHDAAGDEVRARLRSVVSRQLDDELAVTAALMPYFRGQLPEAPDA